MAAHQLGAIQVHMIQQVWLINPNDDKGEYDKGESIAVIWKHKQC